MKICYLARADSYHTYKWCAQMTARGHEIHVISFIEGKIDCATVHYVDCGIKKGNETERQKIKYLTKGTEIRKIIKDIQPDVIHAHRVSSYGLAAILAGVHKCIISVWGIDIYDFPRKTFLHKVLIQFALRRAGQIWSTSHSMAAETQKYTKQDIQITPFGVDMKVFSPKRRSRQLADGRFIVGTVKALRPEYGISDILYACQILKKRRPDIPIYVHIAGKGDQEQELKELACFLGIEAYVKWLGFISQEEAASEWANMDCALILSKSESFGVSAVEAQACGIPVIITDIPGLKEATSPNKSSIVVPVNNPEAVAKELIYLYDHPEIRKQMGEQGCDFVRKKYEITYCFNKIDRLYRDYLNS